MTTRIVQTNTLSASDIQAINEAMPRVRIVRNRVYGFFLCRIPYAALQWVVANDFLERVFFRDAKPSEVTWA
jgi:hypothetical protein